MISIRRLGSLLVTAVVIVATGGMITPTADAHPQTSHPHSLASICTTGHRGQPTYDHRCLTTATPRTAARLWASVPEGKPGRQRDDMTTQRALCTYAHRHGGIRAAARDLVNDMAYDTYRNYRQVLQWVGQDAALTCAQLAPARRI